MKVIKTLAKQRFPLLGVTGRFIEKSAFFLKKLGVKMRKMKKIAVGFVFAAAILTGSAAQVHTITVSEACGECVMPEGMEQYSAYEVLVETYDTVVYSMPELAPPLTALTRRLVARQPGLATTVLIDQIVVGGNVISYSGPGLIVDIIVIQEDGSASRYERQLQDVVEYLFLMQYGRNRRW